MGKETLYNKKNKLELIKIIEDEKFVRKTISFYKYVDLKNLTQLRDNIYKKWNELNILGRVYIANEGINAQISIPDFNVNKFKAQLSSYFKFKNLTFKIAVQDGISFYKLVVKVKNEIVAYNISDKEYDMHKIGKHLDYKEFNSAIDDGAVVIDMRNYYEGEIGKFENAIIPDTERSQELLPEVKRILNSHKNDKILLYCTGGIRCEKASSYLIHHGFSDVNQLNGGIIKYAHDIRENNAKSKFIGKNFVFDERMSEKITNDILGECHICYHPCDSHVNCANEHCHILFIQCNKCAKKLRQCCSKKCSEFMLFSKQERSQIFKRGDIKFTAQKSSKIKPKLKEINQR